MMARRKARSAALKQQRKRGNLLDTLKPEEAQAVLHRLLAAHPDLRPEAEGIARSLLAGVSFEAVAEEVEQALRALALDDLHGRAGSHSWGYVEPSQAAQELLEEAVDPFLEDMKRHLNRGLEAEALEICKGIVLGLYRAREEKGGEFLGWAPDFPEEEAGWVVDIWRAGGDERRAAARSKPLKPPALPRDFVEQFVPEWRWLNEGNPSRR